MLKRYMRENTSITQSNLVPSVPQRQLQQKYSPTKEEYTRAQKRHTHQSKTNAVSLWASTQPEKMQTRMAENLRSNTQPIVWRRETGTGVQTREPNEAFEKKPFFVHLYTARTTPTQNAKTKNNSTWHFKVNVIWLTSFCRIAETLRFKDLPPELRHNIMSQYNVDLTIKGFSTWIERTNAHPHWLDWTLL